MSAVVATALTAVLAGAVVAVLLRPRSGEVRLRETLAPRAPAAAARPANRAGALRTRGAARGRPLRRTPRRTADSTRHGAGDSTRSGAGDSTPTRCALFACVVAGAAALLLVGGPVGLLLAVMVSAAGPVALARLEPQEAREHRERVARDLPLALDLVAACLAGGAALPDALRVVADASPGPCGALLGEVAAALGVGTPPEQAWALLSSRDEHGLAGAAGRALARAGDGGAPVAAAVAVLAAQARARSAADGHRAAARAGVLVVGPLGLCFLPAFVLLGIVPVVVGLVGPLFQAF